MSVIMARQRRDLKGESIPADDGGFYDLYDKWYPSSQPDELDNEFYNTILQVDGKELHFTSVDLEFRDFPDDDPLFDVGKIIAELTTQAGYEASKQIGGEWTEAYRDGYVDGLKRAVEVIKQGEWKYPL